MTFYNGSAREIRGRAQSSSRNIWHEQPVRHALLEMPGSPGIETASASPLAVLKLDDSGVYVSTRKGKRVLVVLMCVFFQPSPPLPQFKEKPRLPKRTGLQVGQRETLAVSGLTRTLHWSARFRFTVPNLSIA